MNQEPIAVIGIDDEGSIFIVPGREQFPFIYREGMDVHWNALTAGLCAPPLPRSKLWSAPRWFQQIIAAARKQGCELAITPTTKWVNISDDVRQEILATHIKQPLPHSW
jgi:hypothetical protein